MTITTKSTNLTTQATCSHLCSSIVVDPPDHLWRGCGSVWACEGAAAVPCQMRIERKQLVQIRSRPVHSGLRPCARYARLGPPVAPTCQWICSWGGAFVSCWTPSIVIAQTFAIFNQYCDPISIEGIWMRNTILSKYLSTTMDEKYQVLWSYQLRSRSTERSSCCFLGSAAEEIFK